MGKREDKSKRQRSAILRAAVAVFSRKGFHKAGVEEIARRAGVGKGTIYLYFEDKSQLFAAAVAEGIESIIQQLRSELESDLPFPRHFQRLVEKSVSLYLESGDLTRIFQNELSNGLEPKARDQILQARSRFLEFLAATLADGHRRGYLRKMDFRLAAVGIVGLLDSLCSYHLQSRKAADKAGTFQTLFALLSTGLIAGKRGGAAGRGAANF